MTEDAHSSTALRADRETSGWAVAVHGGGTRDLV